MNSTQTIDDRYAEETVCEEILSNYYTFIILVRHNKTHAHHAHKYKNFA